jgi:hypothetical protein
MADNSKPDRGPFPGVMGIHTQRAVDALKKGTPGDTYTRREMAEIIGRQCDPNSLGYGNVQSAIRHVETNDGIIWRWDRSDKCWKCLDDDERLQSVDHGIKRHRRGIKREIRVTQTIDPQNLTEDRKRDLELTQIQALMSSQALSGGFHKRLKSNGDSQFREPEPTKLIELMKR